MTGDENEWVCSRGYEDSDPLVLPGETIDPDERTRRKRFCIWHSCLVEGGAAEGSCGSDCLLRALLRSSVDYGNPDNVVVAREITVGDLIRLVGYPRWERVRNQPAVIAALVEEAWLEREEHKRWVEGLEFQV